MYLPNNQWWNIYTKLNLCGGKLKTILDDDEDMITITYATGLLIDVGYVQHLKTYYITVVSTDSIEGWKSPLMIVEVHNKSELFNKIQEIIFIYQSYSK